MDTCAIDSAAGNLILLVRVVAKQQKGLERGDEA